MLEELKIRVCEENKRLATSGLVISTWGNVSARCPQTGYVVIKPSGVSYESMLPEDMVVVSMDGTVIEGRLKPSSDLATHLVIYEKGEKVGGVVHTHSTFATIWAQMGRSIPPFGTTHSDDFYGEIPCTRDLTPEEILGEYERNTGKVILETLGQDPLSFQKTPAVLVKKHGPFVWSDTAEKAVTKAIVLEEVAKMAWHCVSVGCQEPMSTTLMERHFFRKHGETAYYGQ